MQECKVLAEASIPGREPSPKKLVPKSDIYTLALEVKFCRATTIIVELRCISYSALLNV